MQTTFDVDTPSEQLRRRRGADSGLHRLRDRACPGEGGDDGAEVEVALVDAHLLHSGDDLADRAPDRLGVLPVQRVTRSHDDDIGAASKRLRGAHCRMDSEAPGDVVRRRDDATALRIAADHEGPSAKRGLFELLDGGKERVEVEMGEYRHGPNATVRP